MSLDPVQRKERIRDDFQRRRDSVDDDVHDDASRAASERIADLFGGYDHVAGYVALGKEISIAGLLAEVLASEDRHLYLPRVEGEGVLCFVEISDLDELHAGSFGIMEPPGPACELGRIEAFAVPGVAFDRAGDRIGFGKGFYDRVLSSRLEIAMNSGTEVPFFVGVGYHWQVSNKKLPVQPHDVRLHAIVTDRDTIQIDASQTQR